METLIHPLYLLLMAAGDLLGLTNKDNVNSSDSATEINNKRFAALLKEYETYIWKIVRYHIQDEYTRQEAFQHTLMCLSEGLPKFRGDAALKSWVHVVTRNTSIATNKESKKSPYYLFGEIPEHLHPLTKGDTDFSPKLRILLNQLTGLDQTILFMRADDCSYKEIATETGLSENAVTKRHNKITMKLREQLDIKN